MASGEKEIETVSNEERRVMKCKAGGRDVDGKGQVRGESERGGQRETWDLGMGDKRTDETDRLCFGPGPFFILMGSPSQENSV